MQYYFYPRSPCGERPHPIGVLVRVVKISIHALLAESDDYNKSMLLHLNIFLSTLSLRRATIRLLRVLLICLFLSTLSLRRATLYHFARLLCLFKFLSTLSLRRATTGGQSCNSTFVHFYPRSPCGERQGNIINCNSNFAHFYPRSPCGERRTQSTSLSA